MWPQERRAGHETIHTNPMQWNFSGMEGVPSPGLQGSWKYAQKAALSILSILDILPLLAMSGPPPLMYCNSKS